MADDQLKIRDAQIQDASVIADIYNESILAGDATMDDELKSADYFQSLMQNFHEREAILVLEDRAQVLGWGIIKRYSDRSGYRFCCETAVYLKREIMRRGHGSRIKLALIERCKQMGYHHMVAKIFADNKASIQYNERHGYEIVGRQREIGYKRGRWQDVVIMQLILQDVEPEIPEAYR